ncbi:hypothetical protein CAMSH0001_0419 [Campylobacter showae RM3277]|uniref:Uncharacterized protein n=1 Tax=Campylobacter showae RM3277 TaxID=553219 RepID=C6RFB4_9BACT|nr:hypothetical protein CAMSH0001_0419 [Campylobacter showae RM3277]
MRCGDFAANFSSNLMFKSVFKFEPIFKIYFQKRGKFYAFSTFKNTAK